MPPVLTDEVRKMGNFDQTGTLAVQSGKLPFGRVGVFTSVVLFLILIVAGVHAGIWFYELSNQPSEESDIVSPQPARDTTPSPQKTPVVIETSKEGRIFETNPNFLQPHGLLIRCVIKKYSQP